MRSLQELVIENIQTETAVIMSYHEDTIKKMLPKNYLRSHVAHEIYVTISCFKNLVPVMDKYVYNDGTTKNLMSLTGTIPVLYNDKTYNIPVCLWIEENYPETAPICYVKPTQDMMIITGQHISSNGEILLPYLQEWRKSECDIVSLLQVMTIMFGEFPPVCKKPYEEVLCALQFQREAEMFSKVDGNLYLPLTTEDGQPFQPQNETNC